MFPVTFQTMEAMNYEIKYKCALAIHDYLVVSCVRHKFEISVKEFSKLHAECEKLLCTLNKYDTNLQHQIEVKSLLVKHYMGYFINT